MIDRLVRIALADPSHRLPLPGKHGSFLEGARPLTVDPLDPFWAACLADKTVVIVNSDGSKAAPADGVKKRALRAGATLTS